MVRGVIVAESLRTDVRLLLDGFSVTVVRRDVGGGAVGGQPTIWTFLEIEGPDESADALATALAGALEAEGGWYADYGVGGDHVVVFAGRVFRYRNGDMAARAEVAEYARGVGVPEHQLDWPEAIEPDAEAEAAGANATELEEVEPEEVQPEGVQLEEVQPEEVEPEDAEADVAESPSHEPRTDGTSTGRTPTNERATEIQAFWEMVRGRAKLGRLDVVTGTSVASAVPPPAWSFGDNPRLADELLRLVLDGTKTATSSSLAELEAAGEPMPRPGDLSILLDAEGHPRALIRTTRVEVAAFRDVTQEFAALEGEDDRTLVSWRREHERYFRRVLDGTGVAFDEDLPVALERFEVLYPKPQDR